MRELADLLKELLLVPGISGYEEKIRETITTHIQDHLDRLEVDALGNLIGTWEGKGRGHLAFYAHMDELGMVVANITVDGFIHLRKIGGIDDRVLPSQHVTVLTREGRQIPGVIAWVPPHMVLEGQSEMEKVVHWQDLLIDIGTRSDSEVKEMGVRLGDAIVFTKQISYLANNLVACRGMDNRAGCTALVRLIKGLRTWQPEAKLSFVFTTQEEYGLRGAQAAGYNLQPDWALVIDTSSAPDFPGVPQVYAKQFELGKGPLVRLVDVRMIAHRQLQNLVEKIASERGLPLQYGVVGGSTDAAAIQLVRGGQAVLPLCIPCRYTHATVEVISLNDLRTTVDLLQAVVEAGFPFP